MPSSTVAPGSVPAGPAAPPAPAVTVAPASEAPAPPPSATEAPPRPKRRRVVRHTPRRPPEWVLRSKVELAMHADPRFGNVVVEVTQPGVVVLRGTVFDDKTRDAAANTARNVGGVTRVINVLSTQTLGWLETQIRVNQALQQAGLKLVSVKVIGKTAYLSGQVATALDRDRAQTVVITAAPDLTIGTNLITVAQ